MSHGTAGTVSPASGWRNSGAAVSISATPATGYSFSNWTGTGTGSFSGDEQSGFNHNEWTDYRERLLHSEPGTPTPQRLQLQQPHPHQLLRQHQPSSNCPNKSLGLAFTVDGTTYSSTQTFSWAPGSSHTIATISPQNGGTGVRYVWSSWSDSGGISHTVAPTTNTTYTATFTTQYYLTMSRRHRWHGESRERWKNSGATVSITATPTNNTQVSYSFSGWTGSGTGSYSGTNNPASITMNGPITENAAFTQNPVQVTVKRIRLVVVSRLMGLLILRHKPFPGSRVQATPLPQPRRRAVAQAFSMYGLVGATTERSHTLSLLLRTRLTQRHSRRNIT